VAAGQGYGLSTRLAGSVMDEDTGNQDLDQVELRLCLGPAAQLCASIKTMLTLQPPSPDTSTYESLSVLEPLPSYTEPRTDEESDHPTTETLLPVFSELSFSPSRRLVSLSPLPTVDERSARMECKSG
jgi:hypothetical protein